MESGILIQSADPFIFNNKIVQNNENGIHVSSYHNIFCDGKIKHNDISGNLSNGIYCTGKNNRVWIESNYFIGYNKFAGIKLEDEATSMIYKNTIMKNMGQGILLVEGCQAHIE